MDKELLQARMKDVREALEQSLANHHQMIGRLEELNFMMQQLEMQELIDNGEAVE